MSHSIIIRDVLICFDVLFDTTAFNTKFNFLKVSVKSFPGVA